jgi:hypothetical protein
MSVSIIGPPRSGSFKIDTRYEAHTTGDTGAWRKLE